MNRAQKIWNDDDHAAVARMLKIHDSIKLELHLLMLEGAAPVGSPHFDPIPQVLELPLLFRLLETQEGRALCGCMPRIQFRYLSRHLNNRHEMEVAELYLVGVGTPSLHLRFVLGHGGEVRYNSKSDVVDSTDDGLFVFKSRYLERYPIER